MKILRSSIVPMLGLWLTLSAAPVEAITVTINDLTDTLSATVDPRYSATRHTGVSKRIHNHKFGRHLNPPSALLPYLDNFRSSRESGRTG